MSLAILFITGGSTFGPGQWKWAPHNVFGRNTQAFDWGIRSLSCWRQLRWHRLLGTALPFRLVEFTARPSAAPPASDGVDNADPGAGPRCYSLWVRPSTDCCMPYRAGP